MRAKWATLLLTTLFIGCYDTQIEQLQKQIDQQDAHINEQGERLQKLEHEQDKVGNDRDQLQTCLNDADSAYWDYVRLNASSQKKGPSGPLYEAPAFVWQQAAQNKAAAVTECQARYGYSRR